MFTVAQRHPIPGSLPEVWSFLTDPALVREWFADCETLAPGGPVRFDFGDGDFFTGQVRAWDAPRELELSWRFLGIGPTYDISVALREAGASTDVIVEDRGARTREEASALKEGWADFLSRLEERVRTGKCSRYRWTPSFGAEAFAGPSDDVLDRFGSAAWWSKAFPDCEVRSARTGNAIVACFRDPIWRGIETEAHIEVRPDADATIVRVTHEGFDRLPEADQLRERRRYASRWVTALDEIERQSAASSPVAQGSLKCAR